MHNLKVIVRKESDKHILVGIYKTNWPSTLSKCQCHEGQLRMRNYSRLKEVKEYNR